MENRPNFEISHLSKSQFSPLRFIFRSFHAFFRIPRTLVTQGRYLLSAEMNFFSKSAKIGSIPKFEVLRFEHHRCVMEFLVYALGLRSLRLSGNANCSLQISLLLLKIAVLYPKCAQYGV